MNIKKALRIPMEKRPNYYDGQLLLKDDFLAEQRYHLEFRQRHNRKMHGWGVVEGLEVLPRSDDSIKISSGYAIDDSGQDILLNKAENLDLSEFGPNDVVKIKLAYDEEPKGEGVRDINRIACYALITASLGEEASQSIRLANVKLDGQGKVRSDSIDYSDTRYARIVLAPGSVTASELATELQTGWLTMAFKPVPESHEQKVPPFRVGPTEALSFDPDNRGEKDRGSEGSMAIPIPPSVKTITHFRIAGKQNEGEIMIKLILGGWDPKESKHVTRTLVNERITDAPYLKSYEITEKAIDPEYHTLSLWLKGTRRTSVSLVAVEFSYKT
jgi:hypothetical protein